MSIIINFKFKELMYYIILLSNLKIINSNCCAELHLEIQLKKNTQVKKDALFEHTVSH